MRPRFCLPLWLGAVLLTAQPRAQVPNGGFETASPLQWTLTGDFTLGTDGSATFGPAVTGNNYISSYKVDTPGAGIGTATSDEFQLDTPAVITYTGYTLGNGLLFSLIRPQDNKQIARSRPTPLGSPVGLQALISYPYQDTDIQIVGNDNSGSDYLFADNFQERPIRLLIDNFSPGGLSPSVWDLSTAGVWQSTSAVVGPWPDSRPAEGTHTAGTKYNGQDNDGLGVLRTQPITIAAGDEAIGHYMSVATISPDFTNLTATLRNAADDAILAGPATIQQGGGMWFWNEFDVSALAPGTQVYLEFTDNDAGGFMHIDFVCVLGSGAFESLVPGLQAEPINLIPNGSVETASPLQWTLTDGFIRQTDATFGAATDGAAYLSTFFGGPPHDRVGTARSATFQLPAQPQIIRYQAYTQIGQIGWELRNGDGSELVPPVVKALPFGSPSSNAALVPWPLTNAPIYVFGEDQDVEDYLYGDNFRTLPIRLLIDDFAQSRGLAATAWAGGAGDWQATESIGGVVPEPVAAQGAACAGTRHGALGDNSGTGVLRSVDFTVQDGDLMVGFYIASASSNNNFTGLSARLFNAATNTQIGSTVTTASNAGLWNWQEIPLSSVPAGTDVYLEFEDNRTDGWIAIDFVCVLGSGFFRDLNDEDGGVNSARVWSLY